MSIFHDDFFLTIFTVLAAPCMASFGMLMGDRWTEDRPTTEYLRSISVEPSHCDSCGNKITGLSLLPFIGWLITGGRCAKCGAKIPLILLLGELATLAFAAIAVFFYGAMAACFLPAIAGLWAASRSDWRIREIHESACILVAISGLLLAYATGVWADHFIAVAAITTPFIIVLPVYAYLGRIPVVPMGDVYLAAAISFTLTPDMLIVFIAALVPAGFAVRHAVGPKDEAERALPMAPMMALAWAFATIIPLRF